MKIYESMSVCSGEEGIQRCAEEGKSNGKGGESVATKRELEERIEELENAIEGVKDISDKALDPDVEEEVE